MRSLGDIESLLYENTWFDGIVYQTRKQVGNTRIRWVSLCIRFDDLRQKYRWVIDGMGEGECHTLT